MKTPFDGLMSRVHEALVDEWKGSWKLWSVQINALGLAMMAFGQLMHDSWDMLPWSLAQRVPHAETIGMVLFGLGLVGRLLKQVK